MEGTRSIIVTLLTITKSSSFSQRPRKTADFADGQKQSQGEVREEGDDE
jgi:hypothetical protein